MPHARRSSTKPKTCFSGDNAWLGHSAATRSAAALQGYFGIGLFDKFERDRFGDQSAVAGLSEKSADGLAPDFAIIARKFVHVHPNKAVRPFQIEATRQRHAILDARPARAQAVVDALLEDLRDFVADAG